MSKTSLYQQFPSHSITISSSFVNISSYGYLMVVPVTMKRYQEQ